MPRKDDAKERIEQTKEVLREGFMAAWLMKVEHPHLGADEAFEQWYVEKYAPDIADEGEASHKAADAKRSIDED
jgi:hypothetical protein